MADYSKALFNELEGFIWALFYPAGTSRASCFRGVWRVCCLWELCVGGLWGEWVGVWVVGLECGCLVGFL